MRPEDVLDFWFGPVAADGSVEDEYAARWWKKDAGLDAVVRERFGPAITAAAAGRLDHWAAEPRGRVALVIVLDQFSRNAYRDTPAAFAQDERAQRLAVEAVEQGVDRRLPYYERYFLYMPLMHAEDARLQELSVACFETLRADAAAHKKADAARALRYAVSHRDIVARFGRFPHRNRVVGRETTAEEAEFLARPGSSF